MYIEQMKRYQYHMQGSDQHLYHEQHYGPPCRFGYKDLCPQWTLLNWDPDALIERYRKAGAKFFFALANHHDGFDTWNSKHQPWNAQQIGPHRDVIGDWARAARKQSLRFGVTVHQARNWWWFQTSHGADSGGPYKGIPYDGRLVAAEGRNQWWQGLDPQRLYGPKHPYDALPDASYVKNFYDRTRDLIDQHDPDLLYFDNPLFPLGWGGMNIGAYYYNRSLHSRGRMEGVINIKNVPDHLLKAVVADCERGVNPSITSFPWQSETCIGNWHYNRSMYEQPGEFGGYLPPRDVIHWLIDTVSKNGTFVLNIPGRPDGTIDSKEIAVLDQITSWIEVNGEAIFATRPWLIYGEGPNNVSSGSFQGASISKLGEKDIRFTRSKDNRTIYAFALGAPAGSLLIKSLGTTAPTSPGKIQQVQLLGLNQKLAWNQTGAGLSLEMPALSHPAFNFATTLKISV
jgi:alpha-L-fucosidase